MIGITAGAALVAAAIFTAGFSSVIGLGGGMMMLLVTTLTVDFALVMPMFGAIQSSSAISRIWFFRKHLDGDMILKFGIGFVPAAMLSGSLWAYFVTTEGAQPYIKMVIATYMLLFLWFPQFRVRSGNRTRLLLLLGVLSGFAALTVGAVGSVVAPFIDALDLKKERMIAAFGVISIFSNGAKLPLFFLVAEPLDLTVWATIGILIGATFIGTYVGRGIQQSVSDKLFSKIFRTVLGVMALKLLIWDGIRVAYF